MKLSLEQKEGISVLHVDGGVDKHQLQVLKSGLAKLFKDGKNKIIIHFTNVGALDGDIIREMAILDVFARELAGKIVISSADEKLRESILNFAKPPVMPFFTTPDAAIKHFSDEKIEAPQIKDAHVLLTEKTKEVESLKEQLAALDQEKLKGLEERNAELESKVRFLQTQIENLLKEKRIHLDPDALMAKNKALEQSVAKLSVQIVK